jgi:outer membrane protein assembly factor BamB
MFHHDPAHTGYKNSTAPTVTPTVLWSFQAAWITSSPAIVDNHVFVTDYVGSLYCLNASNGVQVWTARGQGSPAVYDGIVYVGHNLITAYNASTGEKIWSDQTLYGSAGRSPTVVDGIVYTSFNGYHAYNASTGTKLWSHTIDELLSAPAVSNGIVYFGGYSLLAVNASTGTEIWRYVPQINPAQTYRDGSPAVYDGYIYAGLSDSFYCLDALTGEKVWDNSKGAFGSSPAVADGVVYFGSQDFNVYALNASTGSKIWNYSTGYLVDSSPAVADGAVYVGSGDGNLCAFNASTGVRLWNFTLQPLLDEKGYSRYLFASPAIANGIIYMGSSDGVVYALGTAPAPTESPIQILLTIIVVSLFFVLAVTIVLCRKRKTKRNLDDH